MGTRVNQVRVVIACMMLNFGQCLSLYYGNIVPYMYSVFFNYPLDRGPDIDPTRILGTYLVGLVVGIMTVDIVRARIGLKLTTVLGIVVYDCSLFLSYFTIQYSVWATAITLAVMGGIGMGLLENTILLHVAGWFTSKVGLASSLAITSNCVGGIVFNVALTGYINPNGHPPDSTKEQISFFSQKDIVDRVPEAFILIGSLSAFMHLLGLCLIKSPPKKASESESINDGDKEINVLSGINETKYSYSSESGPRLNQSDNYLSVSKKDQREQPPCQENTDKTPLQVLKTEMFYYISLSIGCVTFASHVVENSIKIFGFLWITDDNFFAFIGSTASIFTIVFQIGIGHLVDILGVRKVLAIYLATDSFCLCFWCFTPRVSKWLYFIVCNILICLVTSQFLMLPMTTLKQFGVTHFPTNFGLVLTMSVVVNLTSPVVANCLLEHLGWCWMFQITGLAFLVPLGLLIFRGTGN